MNELINTRDDRATIRWKLLTSASALALTAYVLSMGAARAEDTDRPLIWLELGGQAENVSGQGEVFAPEFLAVYPDSSVLQSMTPLQAQRPSKFSFGEEGKISFQPEGSDWVFLAGLRYGRSNNFRHVHHQTDRVFQSTGPTASGGTFHALTTVENFADTQAHHRESHAILDFMAGKDVGLGMFGSAASSTLSLGVRFAQFASKSSVDIRARPDLQIKYFQIYNNYTNPPRYMTFRFPHFHTYHATGYASRSFRGVGPSLSWNGSAPFVGNARDGEMTFDWGVNASILFGKQRAHVRHHETARYFHTNKYYSTLYHHPSAGHPAFGHDTDRSITVPNVGGFAGLSWRVQNFKVSFGYRADFFFGAIDGGIDARKNETLGFKGPYASISIGLGD